jgi:hypothetical protein
MEVEILPLNIVNMSQVLEKSEETKDKIQKELLSLEMEQF